MALRRDLLDCAILTGLATALGIVSLAVRPEIPWIAPPPPALEGTCAPAEDPGFGEAPLVQRIGVAELQARLQVGQVTIVDARPADEFVRGHIPGAISLPVDEAESVLSVQSLPIGADSLVVTYCDDTGGDSEHLCEVLGRAVGCAELRVLDGGFNAWCNAGAPVEDEHGNG